MKIGVGRPADGDVAAHVVRHFDVALAGVMSVACDKACQALMDMVGVRPARDPHVGESGRASNSSEPVMAG